MNSNTSNEGNINQASKKQEIDWQKLIQEIKSSRKLILRACVIGAFIGTIIGFSIPQEYTAGISIVPESSRRSSSSGTSVLGDIADIDMNSSSTIERDAIYSVLYPAIIRSTPFLVRLFNVEVREQKDSTAIPLSQYLKERQRKPWWNVITAAPSRLMGWGMSLFVEKPKVYKVESQIDIFRLTREEAGIAGAIASRIDVEVNETGRKRRVTLSVTMQDPLVAATVADTVLEHLKEYVTEYRTRKARRIQQYAEQIRKEAQADYYEKQEKYTRYADANRNLGALTSRAELVRLSNEMNLALATYKQTELQVRAAEAKVKKMIPVLAVIQPAMVPLAPSKPRKMMIIAGYILLSGAGCIGWILFGRDFLRNLRKKRIVVATNENEQ